MPKIALALVILVVACGLFGANLLNYNIKKDSLKHAVYIDLTFDTPYTAPIQKMTQEGKTILRLQNINFDNTIQEYINLKDIENIILKPLNGDLYIAIESSGVLNIVAVDTNNKNEIKIEVGIGGVATDNKMVSPTSDEPKNHYTSAVSYTHLTLPTKA